MTYFVLLVTSTFKVRIDVHSARLMATVGDLKEETDLMGLDKENNYGVSANVTSVILIGGTYFIIFTKHKCYCYYCFRFEFRRKTTWSEVHNRVFCRLHQGCYTKYRKIGF